MTRAAMLAHLLRVIARDDRRGDGNHVVLLDRHGIPSRWFVHDGLRLAWQRHAGGVMLHLLGGQAARPDLGEQGACVTISATGLDQLIEDLVAVRANLADAPK